MARLEYIRYEFFEAELSASAELLWSRAGEKEPIDELPQVYWEDGAPWNEANAWALDMAASGELDAETIRRKMKHVCVYANFLEFVVKKDWRHFPIRKDERVLNKFRKQLRDEMEAGVLANSTASNCMNAVIQFHRFAGVHNLVNPSAPLWTDRRVVIPFHDSAGFRRTLLRVSTDLSIPNKERVGVRLEDGLLPLRAQHMSELLAYVKAADTTELFLMLCTGFFTGARIGTVVSLTVTGLETAREDPLLPNIYLLKVGPGTGIDTKFDVRGEMMIPKEVLLDLKRYAGSAERLAREAKAFSGHKNLLFLARSGRPYTVETVNRVVYEMRRRAEKAGLHFMRHFKFHQSRATFGTWLMQIAMDTGTNTEAIRLVRDAMLHKDERTTWTYITFLENVKGKLRFGAEFNAAFTGVRSRDWNAHRA